MYGRRSHRAVGSVVAATLVFLLAVGDSALAAPRKPPKPTPTPTPAPTLKASDPTPPTDLRITGLTSYSVSLAWTASTSSVGIQAYLFCCAGNASERTADGNTTTHTFRSNIRPNQTYTIYVSALDNNYRNSMPNPGVTFTTPADTTPPAKPTIEATRVGDNWVSLAWSSAEDAPITYTVTQNGAAILSNSASTSSSFGGLQPETTYTFSVEARDFMGFTTASEPISVTTSARINDVTPPSAPGLVPFLVAPDGETWLIWERSTDDVTPQDLIVYCMYVNGVFDGCQRDFTRAIMYGVPMSRNTYTVTATDRSGNTSESTIELDNF